MVSSEKEMNKKNLTDSYNCIRRINYNITVSQVVLFAYKIGFFDFINERSVKMQEIYDKYSNIRRSSINSIISCSINHKLLENYNNSIKLSIYAKNTLMKNSPYKMGVILDFWNEHDINIETIARKFNKALYKNENIVEFEDFRVEDRKFFIEKMNQKSFIPAMFIEDYIDLSLSHSLLDIGGGSGIFSINIKKVYSNIECSVYEQPCIAKITKEYLKKAGYEKQIKVIEGNMFENKLPKADIHFYSEVFHDWTPKQCITLAKNSFDALPSGGKIVLFEMLFDSTRSSPFNVVGQDVTMQLFTEGQQFTKDEINNLLKSVGYVELSIVQTHTDYCFITAVKP